MCSIGRTQTQLGFANFYAYSPGGRKILEMGEQRNQLLKKPQHGLALHYRRELILPFDTTARFFGPFGSFLVQVSDS